MSEKRTYFARANYIGKAVSFARARYIGKAVSFARARGDERADFFRQGKLYRKSDSPARAVHWRVPGSVLRDRPGGRLPAFTVLPALAIQRLPFPAKRNGGGSFVMASVAGPRGIHYFALKKGRPAPGRPVSLAVECGEFTPCLRYSESRTQRTE